MSRATRGLPFRFLAVAVLLAVAGVLAAGAAAARHHHGGPGLYDDRCPIEALATLERSAGVVTVVTATPVEAAAPLSDAFLLVRPALSPVADARLRAPPAR
jgi:hypothetical protein